MRIDLRHGDCLDVLRSMPDCSVDAVVTDPPYGFGDGKRAGFMGKKWDYDVPSVAIWSECLRVLKPGGHLLAFAGTRTQHRMAVRIEDAGFEIRDMIAWVYGSGFPKSLDVSKAIDKMDAADVRTKRQMKFCEWMRGTNLNRAHATEVLRAAGVISENGTMAGHFFAASVDGQPAVATRELFEVMRPHFGCDVPEWVEQLVDERTVESENFKRREVVGVQKGAMAGWSMDGGTKFVDRNITAPATPEAQQWAGWGTALKPSWECITMARKPLAGTVAANVLEHGTGAINVDGCRVEGDRWPGNLIHEGSEEVVRLFPQSSSGANPTRRGGMGYHGAEGQESCDAPRGAESGSAARFFYCAKASKRDRDEGLDAFAIRSAGEVTGGREDGSAGLQSPRAGAGRTNGARNHHPTVKPTDLMRYLCRLVTPPGGIVLDPFMGSGSTGKAAILEGFRFIGIEREAEYMEIARARIEAVTPTPATPAEAEPPYDADQLPLF